MYKDKPAKPFYKKKRFLIPAALILLFLLLPKPAADTQPSGTGSDTSKVQKADEFNAQAAYDNINAGMSRSDAEKIIGIEGRNCSESAIEGFGTTVVCSYSKGFSSSILTVSYQDGVVTTKNITNL